VGGPVRLAGLVPGSVASGQARSADPAIAGRMEMAVGVREAGHAAGPIADGPPERQPPQLA